MPLSPEDADPVQRLAAHADLPLTPDRLAAVGPLLAAWTRDANALSAKMRAPQYAEVTPITGLLQAFPFGGGGK